MEKAGVSGIAKNALRKPGTTQISKMRFEPRVSGIRSRSVTH
jgi:hypothetical protein